MGGRSSWVVLAVMVAATAVAVAVAEEGEQALGECLMVCGEKIVACAAECGMGGNKPNCYEDCGDMEVKCIKSCVGANNIKSITPHEHP